MNRIVIADPFTRRCPRHNEALDPDTGCDACAADARADCTWCGGVGMVPYIAADGTELPTPCRHCHRAGIPAGWGLGW